MTKEEIVQKVGKPLLRPLGVAQLVSLIGFFTSPIIWIWCGWNLAWKVGLTLLVICAIISIFYHAIKQIIEQMVNEEVKPIKSGFMQRLEESIENSAQKEN